MLDEGNVWFRADSLQIIISWHKRAISERQKETACCFGRFYFFAFVRVYGARLFDSDPKHSIKRKEKVLYLISSYFFFKRGWGVGGWKTVEDIRRLIWSYRNSLIRWQPCQRDKEKYIDHLVCFSFSPSLLTCSSLLSSPLCLSFSSRDISVSLETQCARRLPW